MQAGEIWVKLGLDSTNLEQGFARVKGGLTNWRDETNANTMDLAKWAAAFMATIGPIIAVGAALFKTASDAGEFGHAIEESSRMLGLSTDQFQQWSHVAIASGVNADAFTTSVRMMTTRMKEAADPTSVMGKTLADLGVTVVDANGNFRNTTDVLEDEIAALSAMPNGFAKNQISMEIFGRSWYQIAPLLQLSREEIDKLIAQAPIISQDKIDQEAAFHTQLALVNEQYEKAYTEIGRDLIPVMEDLMPLITDYGIPALKDLADFLSMAGRGFHMLGSEAKWASEMLHGDFAAALQTDKDLFSWIQAQQTADALKASGFKPPTPPVPSAGAGVDPEVARKKFFAAYNAEIDPVKQQKMLDAYGGMPASETVGNPQMRNGVHVEIHIGTVVTPDSAQFARTIGGALDKELQRQRIAAGIGS
jgi:hypothetical protein